jgi:hypothetical protein
MAPQNNYFMVCERPCISKYVSTMEPRERLMTLNTILLWIFGIVANRGNEPKKFS